MLTPRASIKKKFVTGNGPARHGKPSREKMVPSSYLTAVRLRSSSASTAASARVRASDSDEAALLTGSADGIGQSDGTFQVHFSDGSPSIVRKGSSSRKVKHFPLSPRRSGIILISLPSPSAIAWCTEGPHCAPTNSSRRRCLTCFVPPRISHLCTFRKRWHSLPPPRRSSHQRSTLPASTMPSIAPSRK